MIFALPNALDKVEKFPDALKSATFSTGSFVDSLKIVIIWGKTSALLMKYKKNRFNNALVVFMDVKSVENLQKSFQESL